MPGAQSLKALQQRCSNLELDLENALKMLREREEVLTWASDNVLSAFGKYTDEQAWSVNVRSDDTTESCTAPTLYDALLAAYKESKQ